MTDPFPADWARPGPDDVALHHRVVEFSVYDRGEHMAVIGTLRDERPWAAPAGDIDQVHDMGLAVLVRGEDLAIVDVDVEMRRFPHPECRAIEAAFSGLVGLHVGRGYTRAVQERFGRSLGCTHLEFMARAVAPVVIQALASYRRQSGTDAEDVGGARRGAVDWLAGSCHIWAEGGVAEQKVALGWRPGGRRYPAPSLVELGRSSGPGDEEDDDGAA